MLILNSVAGNVGRTVFAAERLVAHGASLRGDGSGIRAMAGGGVGVVMVHGANPAFTLPATSGFADAFRNVAFKVSFADSPDETSALADLILPDRHFLESWGDSNPRPGVYAVQQPAMQPVPMFDTKQTGDVLASLATRMGRPLAAATVYDHLVTRWRELHAAGARVPEGTPAAGNRRKRARPLVKLQRPLLPPLLKQRRPSLRPPRRRRSLPDRPTSTRSGEDAPQGRRRGARPDGRARGDDAAARSADDVRRARRWTARAASSRWSCTRRPASATARSTATAPG